MKGRPLVVAVGLLVAVAAPGFAATTEPSVAAVEPSAKQAPLACDPAQEKTQAASEKQSESGAPTSEPGKGGWFKGLEVRGLVDFYSEFNLNRPPPAGRVRSAPGTEPKFLDPVGVENALRNFDFKSNELALNLVEVVIEKPAGPLGFRLDLDFGPATDWVHNAEPGGRRWKYVQQAFLTFPVGGKYGDKVDVGKFVTHHGAEVIESQDNFNYTRGFLFGFAIPYYHAGVRYWHYTNKERTNFICWHLYNGWNNVKDNNGSKSFGASYGFKPSAKMTVIENITVGKEPVDNPVTPTVNGNRFLSDTLITYAAADKTTYALNVDWGRQNNTSAALGAPRARWYGVAGYVRRAMDDKHALALRLEWFRDRHGFTTGTAQTLREATLTYEVKRRNRLIWHFEARYDRSSRPVFLSRGGMAKRSQMTIAIGPVVLF